MMGLQTIATYILVGLAAIAASCRLVRFISGRQSAPTCPGCRAVGGCPHLKLPGRER
jgi:hypothetical protein